jgi:hypothetical protein
MKIDNFCKFKIDNTHAEDLHTLLCQKVLYFDVSEVTKESKVKTNKLSCLR